MWVVLRKPSPLKINHAQAAPRVLFLRSRHTEVATEKSYGDGQEANLTGADMTGNHSLEPAYRRRGLDCRLV